jgi:NAD-dependent dihydropyrimidine dehydrogenase PreA subunit
MNDETPPSRDPAKAKRAANDPARPGEECNAAPGTWRPVVDRRRCEGKSDCVAVCPYDVFRVGTIAEDEYRALPLLARLKLRVHGKQTVFMPNIDACRACGLCVVACPEDALSLVRASG